MHKTLDYIPELPDKRGWNKVQIEGERLVVTYPDVWGFELQWHKSSDDENTPSPLSLFPNLRDLCDVLECSNPHTDPTAVQKKVDRCPHSESDHSLKNGATLLSHSSSRLSVDFAAISLGMDYLTSSSSELDLWLHRKLSRFQKDLQPRNFLWVG